MLNLALFQNDPWKAVFNEFHRDFRPFLVFDGGHDSSPLTETDDGYVLTLTVPGWSEKAFQIKASADSLEITGERSVEPPAGYRVLRQERRQLRFARKYTLPKKADVDSTTATLKDGVLTVELKKSKEAQPRQIPVNVAEPKEVV